MGYCNDSSRIDLQIMLKPCHTLGIEIMRRLIKKQDVLKGLHEKNYQRSKLRVPFIICAYETVKEMMQAVMEDNTVVPGMIVAIQTFDSHEREARH